MNKDAITIATIIIGVALFIGLVGKHDYEDEVAALKVYCHDVKTGVYPDYQMKYSTQCVDN